MNHVSYRRRSVFGGLLLILIGVIFLLHEFRPGFGIGRLFTHYWPVLLILWGLARLWDHMVSMHTGEARPPAISGGEVALIFLLILVVAGIAGFDWAQKQNPDFNIGVGLFDHSYDWSEELPAVAAKPGKPILISTPHGDITVRPAEDSRLHVIVRKTAIASNRSSAKQRADAVKVSVSTANGGYQIQPQVAGDEDTGVKISLEVQVPANSNLTAKTQHGGISISQLTGPVTAAAREGNMDIHGIAGDVTASLEHGDARFNGIQGNLRVSGQGSEIDIADVTGDTTIDGDFYGPIRAHNVAKTTQYTSSRTNLTVAHLRGQMEMDSGDLDISDTPGSVQLTTVDKDITLENIGGRIDITDRRGDIRVRFAEPPHNEVHIGNESGNVELALPARSDFTIAAVARSGDIHSDFQAPSLKAANGKETSSLRGSFGARGPQINVTTDYGTIRLHKVQ